MILYNVTKADGTIGSVTISKSNNLRSLVFIPQVYVDGVQGLTYDSYAYKALTLSDKGFQGRKKRQLQLPAPLSIRLSMPNIM